MCPVDALGEVAGGLGDGDDRFFHKIRLSDFDSPENVTMGRR